MRTMTVCTLAAGLFSVFALSCAGMNAYESAERNREAGRCAEAVEGYTAAIESPGNDHELARSYYFRSRCNEELGRTGPAYADAYAAQRVSCYLTATERTMRTRPLSYVVGPFYCRQDGPARLEQLGAGLSGQEAQALRMQVDEGLPRRILNVPLPE